MKNMLSFLQNEDLKKRLLEGLEQFEELKFSTQIMAIQSSVFTRSHLVYELMEKIDGYEDRMHSLIFLFSQICIDSEDFAMIEE